MTQEVLNLNAFFSYFFVIGNYIYLFFAGAIIVGIFVSFLEFLFHKE